MMILHSGLFFGPPSIAAWFKCTFSMLKEILLVVRILKKTTEASGISNHISKMHTVCIISIFGVSYHAPVHCFSISTEINKFGFKGSLTHCDKNPRVDFSTQDWWLNTL